MADRVSPDSLTIRSDLRPGDIGTVAAMHGMLYAREYGFDHTFEAYVAGPLADFALRNAANERIWLAEQAGRLVGVVAIVAEDLDGRTAQLRWFLVDPSARGMGLGRRLLHQAIEFSRASGYDGVVLWTVSALETAARLYRSAGFKPTETQPGRRWGTDVVEEKYELLFS